MADTTINSSLVQKIWSKEVLLQAKQQSFVERFAGTSKQSILYRMDRYGKQKGDTIYVPLLKSLTGSGQTGDNTLEGNEEAMVYSASSITLQQYRHAVRLEGQFEEQKTAINMREDARDQLADWVARKWDSLFFAAANPASATVLNDAANWSSSGTYSNYNVVCAGDATDFADLEATDVLTADVISKAKRYAMMRGIRPARVTVNGVVREVYVLIISPEQEYDLRTDDRWIDAQAYAQVRGVNNPLFTGALGMYDGVLVHTYTNTIDGGSDATLLITEDKTTFRATCALLLGAQGVAMAVAKDPTWFEKVFDYGNKYGVSTRFICGFCKPIINLGTEASPDNRDYGVCYVLTAATKLA